MDKDRVSELIHEYAIDLGGRYGVLVPEENFGGLAEAIAERTKVGVIPLGTGIFGYHYDAFHRRYAMIELDDALKLGLPDGQRICVMATKLEGEDGQVSGN